MKNYYKMKDQNQKEMVKEKSKLLLSMTKEVLVQSERNLTILQISAKF